MGNQRPLDPHAVSSVLSLGPVALPRYLAGSAQPRAMCGFSSLTVSPTLHAESDGDLMAEGPLLSQLPSETSHQGIVNARRYFEPVSQVPIDFGYFTVSISI